MSGPRILWILVMIILTLVFSIPGYGKEVEIEAIGLRGGINLEYVAIPPTEDHNFYQADAFMVLALPWKWRIASGLVLDWRVNTAAGFLWGGGDTAFIAELGPGLALHIPSWRMIVDTGTGLAALTKYHFGGQNMGGPVQIVGHFGVGFDLGWNLFAGWRFHHMSDATIYGNHTKGVDLNFLEFSYRF